MLKRERLKFILDEIRTYNKVLSVELSEKLNVSEDTVRRDIRELSKLGKLKKVYGGAISVSYIPFTHKEREVYAHEEKVEIVRKARSLISDEDVIFIDGGTTNLEFARLLPEGLRATVITNSLPIALQLTDHPTIELIFFGGKILKSAQVAIGTEVITALEDIRANICFIGTRSLDPEIGLTDLDREEAQVKKALLRNSEEIISLAISEKLYTYQQYRICDVTKINTLVTELSPDDPKLIPFMEKGLCIL